MKHYEVNALMRDFSIKSKAEKIKVLCNKDVVNHYRYAESVGLISVQELATLTQQEKDNIIHACFTHIKINHWNFRERIDRVVELIAGIKDDKQSLSNFVDNIYKQVGSPAAAVYAYFYGSRNLARLDDKLHRAIAQHGIISALGEYQAKYETLNKLPPVMRMRCLEKATKNRVAGNNFIKTLTKDQLDNLLFPVINRYRAIVQSIEECHRIATADETNSQLFYYILNSHCPYCGPIKHMVQTVIQIDNVEELKNKCRRSIRSCPICFRSMTGDITASFGKGKVLS